MKTSLIKVALVAAATSLIGLATVGPSAPAHAATRTIVGQGAYLCQSKPKGLPMETYLITLRMTLTAPTSVTPGQSVSLSGTATMQFPEKAYQEGKTYGETEADGYSNTLSVGVTSSGGTSDAPANRWQTAPFPWRDPVVVSAPITLHPFTVPQNATGSVTITLPRNEHRAPNTASSSPATVAFNAVANNKTSLGNVSENLGCYLDGSAPSVVGTIPITTGPPATDEPTSDGPTSAPDSPETAAPLGTSNDQAAPPGAAGTQPVESDAPEAGAPPQSAPLDTAAGAPGMPAYTPVSSQAPTAGSTRSGVFVPTNVLVLSGGLISILALGYAGLTQYRMRTIKKAMDG